MKKFIIGILLFTSVASAGERIQAIDIAEGQNSRKEYAGSKGHFERNVAGVTAYADAAGVVPVDGTGGSPTLTCTQTTSAPISGSGSLLITSTGTTSKQGQGCALAFTNGGELKSKQVRIEFDYIVGSGTFVAGAASDLIVDVYDVTNSAIITPTNIRPMVSSTTIVDKFVATFTTSATGVSYRLIWHAATTSALDYTVKIDNVKLFQVNEPPPTWYIDAILDGASPSMGVIAVTSYTEIIDGGLTLKPQTGSAAVGVMCSTTNAATAPSTGNTTCAAGSESVGINFALPPSHSAYDGTYEVCFYGSKDSGVDSGEETFGALELIETPTNAQTLTLEGGTRQYWECGAITIATGTAAFCGVPVANCSIFNWTAKAAGATVGVRLMFEQSVAGTPFYSTLIMDAGANYGQPNSKFTVKRIR